jgi:hypothetical protein
MDADFEAWLDNGYVDIHRERLQRWIRGLGNAQNRKDSHVIATQLEAECETTIKCHGLNRQWVARIEGLYRTWETRSLAFPVSYIHFEGDPIEYILRKPGAWKEAYLARVGYYATGLSCQRRAKGAFVQGLVEPHTLISDFRAESIWALPVKQDDDGGFHPTGFSYGINHLTDVQLLRSPLHRYVWQPCVGSALDNPDALVNAVLTMKRLAMGRACTLSVLQPPVLINAIALGTMHDRLMFIGSAPNVKHLRLRPPRPIGWLFHPIGARKLTSRLRRWDDVIMYAADEVQQIIWEMLPGLTCLEYRGRVSVTDALDTVSRRLVDPKQQIRSSERRALIPHALEVAKGTADEYAGTWFWHNAPPGLKTITFKSHVDALQDEEELMQFAKGAPHGVTLEYIALVPTPDSGRAEDLHVINETVRSYLRDNSTSIRWRGSREKTTNADVCLVCARVPDSYVSILRSDDMRNVQTTRYVPSNV